MYQSVTVPRIFSDTGTGTFFRDQFFPVPVPVPAKKRENSRDRDKTGTIWDFFKSLKILTQYLQHLIPFRADVDILVQYLYIHIYMYT